LMWGFSNEMKFFILVLIENCIVLDFPLNDFKLCF
jgi:hypothetical protein